MSCTLVHIPERLHTDGRPDLPVFYQNEAIYRRGPVDADNPFTTLRLIDISVNREGEPRAIPVLSKPNDVLLNFHPTNPGTYVLGVVVKMVLKEIATPGIYVQTFEYIKLANNLTYGCRLFLRHDKTPCNYSHCVFDVFFTDAQGEQLMTHSNYNQALGKHPKLQTWAKLELAKMIEREEIPMTLTQDVISTTTASLGSTASVTLVPSNGGITASGT